MKTKYSYKQIWTITFPIPVSYTHLDVYKRQQLDITKATYVTDSSCTIKCMEDSRNGRKRVSARLDNFSHYTDQNSTDATLSQTNVRSGVIRIIKTII